MDGRMDMYAPLATRGGGGRREMKMETEMPNTYLPTHLLAYPCTWSAFCQYRTLAWHIPARYVLPQQTAT